jgi:hypothetical protein
MQHSSAQRGFRATPAATSICTAATPCDRPGICPRPYVDEIAAPSIVIDAAGCRFADEGLGSIYLSNAVAMRPSRSTARHAAEVDDGLDQASVEGKIKVVQLAIDD